MAVESALNLGVYLMTRLLSLKIHDLEPKGKNLPIYLLCISGIWTNLTWHYGLVLGLSLF